VAMRFETATHVFPSGTGPRTISDSVVFSKPVKRAAVALNGWQLQYEPPGSFDHPVSFISADTSLGPIAGNTVDYSVSVRLEDVSANDNYSGFVTALIIAEV
jgi:hypothetical protein